MTTATMTNTTTTKTAKTTRTTTTTRTTEDDDDDGGDEIEADSPVDAVRPVDVPPAVGERPDPAVS